MHRAAVSIASVRHTEAQDCRIAKPRHTASKQPFVVKVSKAPCTSDRRSK